jgi:hypothetical protein
MTYTYTVTTYSYNCQVCGTRSGGVPRMSEIPRCLVCDIALCKHCFQHGFCPTHWQQVPSNLQQQLTDIHRKVERRKKIGFVGFILCIMCALGVFIGEGSAGRIEIAMPVGFSLLVLAIIFIVPAASPIKRFRKKELKFLARSGVQIQAMTGTTTQSVRPPSQTVPSASKKFCSACGASINKDAVFCEKCGAKVGGP